MSVCGWSKSLVSCFHCLAQTLIPGVSGGAHVEKCEGYSQLTCLTPGPGWGDARPDLFSVVKAPVSRFKKLNLVVGKYAVLPARWNSTYID